MNNTVQYWGRNIGYVYLRKTGSDAIDLICNGGSERRTILVIQQGRCGDARTDKRQIREETGSVQRKQTTKSLEGRKW